MIVMCELLYCNCVPGTSVVRACMPSIMEIAGGVDIRH